MARHITRDMALPLSWIFLHTRITANQVTSISLFAGCAGCAFFGAGTKQAMLFGAFLLQLWYLLDHVDGHIARYRKQSNLTGVYFDYLTHYVVHAGIFTGIGYGVFRKTGNLFYLMTGVAAAMAIIFFNLCYDVLYKAYFSRIKTCGYLVVRRKTSAGQGTDPARRGVSGRIFSFIHKTCEVHVLMNVVTVLAVFSFFWDLDVWRFCITYYAFAAVFISIMKNAHFVLFRVPDRTFEETFEADSES